MAVDVDWTHGAAHMVRQHGISVPWAAEALDDLDAVIFDPDPKSTSGVSARVIGYSPQAKAILVVILVHRDDGSGGWWGANAWRANTTDIRIYQEGRTQ